MDTTVLPKPGAPALAGSTEGCGVDPAALGRVSVAQHPGEGARLHVARLHVKVRVALTRYLLRSQHRFEQKQRDNGEHHVIDGEQLNPEDRRLFAREDIRGRQHHTQNRRKRYRNQDQWQH